MNNFLNNLIERHQTQTGEHAANRVVQPRIRQRYENDSATADLNPTEIDTDRPVKLAPASVTEEKPSDTRPEAETNNHLTDHNQQPHRILRKAVTPPIMSGQHDKAETAVTAARSMKHRKDISHTESAENNILARAQQDDHTAAEDMALNTRIRQLQQDMIMKLTPTAGMPDSVINNPVKPASTDADHNQSAVKASDAGPANHLQAVIDEQIVRPSSVSSMQSLERSALHQQQDLQNGHLQIPAWLTELQQQLGQRWQDQQSPTEKENVVNVTIRRIDVTAAPDDKGQQKSSPGKPSGIMSLDDYLKKRDRQPS